MECCPGCGSAVSLSGTVRCLCDKDFCMGQRCGASEMSRHYQCTNPNCLKEGMPDETRMYYDAHERKLG